jgi:hypothetical protein
MTGPRRASAGVGPRSYRPRLGPSAIVAALLSGMLLGEVKSGIEEGVAMNVKTAKARVEGK